MPPKRKIAVPKELAKDSLGDSDSKVTTKKTTKRRKAEEGQNDKDTIANDDTGSNKTNTKKISKRVAGQKKNPAETKEPFKPSKKNTKSSKSQVEEDEPIEKSNEDLEVIKETKKGRTKKTKQEKVEITDREEDTAKPVKRGRTKAVNDEATEPKRKNTTTSVWDSINFTCDKKNQDGKTYNLKISSWNIGGLKSWVKKECIQYIEYENPDIFCMQETKCNESKLPNEIKALKDYKQYWCASEKDGYAGVGLLSKVEPLAVTYGIDNEEMDQDGRCITAEYDNFYVVCVYVPNSGRGLVTLPKRLRWNDLFKEFINKLNEKKPVIICGDMNVSHKETDLARPKNNTKNAGFTPEEREGMTNFLEEGYVDSFRALYPDTTDVYTFWTYMSNARANNVGWRLDYFIVSEVLMRKICDNVVRSQVAGSDHCPITLFLNI